MRMRVILALVAAAVMLTSMSLVTGCGRSGPSPAGIRGGNATEPALVSGVRGS